MTTWLLARVDVGERPARKLVDQRDQLCPWLLWQAPIRRPFLAPYPATVGHRLATRRQFVLHRLSELDLRLRFASVQRGDVEKNVLARVRPDEPELLVGEILDDRAVTHATA